MLEISHHHYSYALYILLISAASACIIVIQSLKGSDLPVKSIQLFQTYFIINVIGWFFLALKDLSHVSVDLSVAAIFYIVASFILFIAVVECARNKKTTIIIALYHLAVILTCVLLYDDIVTVLVISTYIFSIYPFIVLVSIKRAIKSENIGNAIIAFAAFVVTATAPLQIYLILSSGTVNTAFSIIVIASAVTFLLVGIGFLTSILIDEHKLLSSMALKDPLTGLLNRRGMEFELRPILAAAKRNKTYISAIAIDIDFFKKVNDKYGHAGGDLALQSMAGILLQCPRDSDVCCRLGGEEFIFVLPETRMADALNIAERIRQLIEQTQIASGENNIKLTASLGVATSKTDIDIDSLLKDADKALYKAKAEGRNCVRQTF